MRFSEDSADLRELQNHNGRTGHEGAMTNDRRVAQYYYQVFRFRALRWFSTD